jgi:dimeric dUTPase (all-alpha-NTP-PPase superfamily)
MSAQAQQLKIMLDLQDAMNIKVTANWQAQGYEWYRAIWVECAELMDHYGWKWWKKQSPDTEQVALELIDIWHFGLSILLQSGASVDEIIARLQNELVIATDEKDFRIDLEKFVAATLADHQFHIGLFARLMAGVDMSFEQLYRGYVGKNVLNFFRQDNGYKDGSYRKHWHDGREDNEHLVEAVLTLDATKLEFKDELYQALVVRYQQ